MRKEIDLIKSPNSKAKTKKKYVIIIDSACIFS